MTRRCALRALAGLALAGPAFAGCGKKGLPVAPERRRPQPVTDLTAAVREDRIELAWTLPRRRADQRRLLDLAEARVFRAEDDGTGEPKAAMVSGERVAGYTEIATLPLGDRPAAAVQGDRVGYTDQRGLTIGRRYTYVVLSTDGAGRTSPPSPRVSVTFLAAPEPPGELTAEPGEGRARLAWTPPSRNIDGTAISGQLTYEVLRGAAAEGPFAPMQRTRAGQTSIEDRNLQNDSTYWYAVRTLREESRTIAQGPASAPVAVTPVKVTAPAAPRELTAVASTGEVRLSWAPSLSSDVATYVIYRASATGAFLRVGAMAPPATTFLDREVPRGDWRYAVTAQDASAHVNESGRSNVVRVSVP